MKLTRFEDETISLELIHEDADVISTCSCIQRDFKVLDNVLSSSY